MLQSVSSLPTRGSPHGIPALRQPQHPRGRTAAADRAGRGHRGEAGDGQVEVIYDKEQLAPGDEWRQRIAFMLHACHARGDLLDENAREVRLGAHRGDVPVAAQSGRSGFPVHSGQLASHGREHRRRAGCQRCPGEGAGQVRRRHLAGRGPRPAPAGPGRDPSSRSRNRSSAR